MRKKIAILTLVVVALLIFSVSIKTNGVDAQDSREARSERIASILQNAWDKFSLYSFEIGYPDPSTGIRPTIWIVMDEAKSDLQLQRYLEKKIKKSDLKHYNIDITKKSLQEMRQINIR